MNNFMCISKNLTEGSRYPYIYKNFISLEATVWHSTSHWEAFMEAVEKMKIMILEMFASFFYLK